MDTEQRGLYGKYRVAKVGGTPVDKNAKYFVLRIDTDPAARAALPTTTQSYRRTF